MEFKILWLYYDLLDLYGDRGNIKVLEYILKHNNIKYKIDKITINEEDKKDTDYDLVFLGGGSDKNQQLIESDLKSRKNQLKSIMDNKGFILTVCGGYQLFGKYYLDQNGNKIEGLGLFDYYTKAHDRRCIGNVKIKSKIKLDDDFIEIVGFENHSGQTHNVNKENALGTVINGNGNEYKGKFEGYISNNFIGTYIHGPLLPKNPQIAKYIIQKVLKDKHNKNINIKLNHDNVIKKAKEEIKYNT